MLQMLKSGLLLWFVDDGLVCVGEIWLWVEFDGVILSRCTSPPRERQNCQKNVNISRVSLFLKMAIFCVFLRPQKAKKRT